MKTFLDKYNNIKSKHVQESRAVIAQKHRNIWKENYLSFSEQKFNCTTIWGSVLSPEGAYS